MSNELVVFRLDGNNISANAQAIELRESAIAAGALIGSVTDEESNAQATDAMRRIKQVLSLCESSRKKVKEPVLDLARRIAVDRASIGIRRDDKALRHGKPMLDEFRQPRRFASGARRIHRSQIAERNDELRL